MSEELRSFLTGTIFLDIMLLIALAVTVTRGAGAVESGARREVMRVGAVALPVQFVHMLEEWWTGFYERFPEFLGLHPWSEELFLGLNLTWIGIWLVSLQGVRAGLRVALFPLWFLGIGSLVNGAAHPLLSVAVGGYFPGLWTSPLCGLMGLLLLGTMGRFTAGGSRARLES